jgi:hypothetical protein
MGWQNNSETWPLIRSNAITIRVVPPPSDDDTPWQLICDPEVGASLSDPLRPIPLELNNRLLSQWERIGHPVIRSRVLYRLSCLWQDEKAHQLLAQASAIRHPAIWWGEESLYHSMNKLINPRSPTRDTPNPAPDHKMARKTLQKLLDNYPGSPLVWNDPYNLVAEMKLAPDAPPWLRAVEISSDWALQQMVALKPALQGATVNPRDPVKSDAIALQFWNLQERVYRNYIKRGVEAGLIDEKRYRSVEDVHVLR